MSNIFNPLELIKTCVVLDENVEIISNSEFRDFIEEIERLDTSEFTKDELEEIKNEIESYIREEIEGIFKKNAAIKKYYDDKYAKGEKLSDIVEDTKKLIREAKDLVDTDRKEKEEIMRLLASEEEFNKYMEDKFKSKINKESFSDFKKRVREDLEIRKEYLESQETRLRLLNNVEVLNEMLLVEERITKKLNEAIEAKTPALDDNNISVSTLPPPAAKKAVEPELNIGTITSADYDEMLASLTDEDRKNIGEEAEKLEQDKKAPSPIAKSKELKQDESKHIILNKREAKKLAKEYAKKQKVEIDKSKEDLTEVAKDKEDIKNLIMGEVREAAKEFFPKNQGVREFFNNRQNKKKIDAYTDRVAEQIQIRKIDSKDAVKIFQQLYVADMMEEGFKLASKSINKIEKKAYNDLSKEQKAQLKADFIAAFQDKYIRENPDFMTKVTDVVNQEKNKNLPGKLISQLKDQLGRTILINTAKDVLKSNSTITKKYNKKEIDIMLDIEMSKLPNGVLKDIISEVEIISPTLLGIEAKLDIQRKLGDIGKEFYPNVKIDEQKLRFLAQLADEIQSLKVQENNLDDVLKKVMYKIGVSGYTYNQALSKEALEKIIADVKAKEMGTESSPDQRERGNIERDEVAKVLGKGEKNDIATAFYDFSNFTEGKMRSENRNKITELAQEIGITNNDEMRVVLLNNILNSIAMLNSDDGKHRKKRANIDILKNKYVKELIEYAVSGEEEYNYTKKVLTGLKPGAIGGRKEYLQMVNEIMDIKDNWSPEELGEIKEFLDKKGVFYKSSIKAKIHGTGENRVDIDKFNKYKNEMVLMRENKELYKAINGSHDLQKIHDTDKYMVTIADRLVKFAQNSEESLADVHDVGALVKLIEDVSLSNSIFGRKGIDPKLMDKNKSMLQVMMFNKDLYDHIKTEIEEKLLKDKPKGYELTKKDKQEIFNKTNEIANFIVKNDQWKEVKLFVQDEVIMNKTDNSNEEKEHETLPLLKALLNDVALSKTDAAKQGAVDKFIDESVVTQEEIKDLKEDAAEKLGVDTTDVMQNVKRIRENIGYVFNSETGRRSDSLPSKINVLTAIAKSEDRPPFNSGNEDKLRKWYEKAMKSEGQDKELNR